MPENMTFEEAMERLEVIAGELEKGNLPLEQSLKLYEEGAALTAFCSKQLKNAQQRITELASDTVSEQDDPEE